MPLPGSVSGNLISRRRKKIRPRAGVRWPSPTAPILANRIKLPKWAKRKLGKHSAVYPCKG